MKKRMAAELASWDGISMVRVTGSGVGVILTGWPEKSIRSLEKTAPQTIAASWGCIVSVLVVT